MPSDNGMDGLIVAETLMSLDFERWRRERLANWHFQSLEAENLALKQEIDQLLGRYNQLVAQYNAIAQDRKQLAVNYETMRDICRSWEADYKRLEAWAENVEKNGHRGGKR